jgi:signal peptidase I
VEGANTQPVNERAPDEGAPAVPDFVEQSTVGPAPVETMTKPKRRRTWVRELVETAVLTIAIFLVVRIALQNFKVEGDSMFPTLHDGEYILVNKIDYMLSSPHRGDIIVFNATPAHAPDKDFIKRVIGLPGDHVAVHDGSVWINGKRLNEPYEAQAPDYTWPSGGGFGSIGTTLCRIVASTCVIPPDDYFVLGDNRNNSQDSHLWGLLPRHYIVGKAWISYWPVKDLHVFDSARPFPHTY